MAKYLLSYDEEDIKAGLVPVDNDVNQPEVVK